MQLWFLDGNFGKVPIYDWNSDIKSLTHEFKLSMDVDDPLNQEASGSVFNFTLNFL